MITCSHPGAQQRGFSLVELLVSVVVGLLALMFATKLFVASEQNRESSLGGSDSMQNGMLALFSINRDVAQAGWGLNDPLIAGCKTVFADTRGYQLGTATRSDVVGTYTPMAAALIESNGADPDRLSLYAGTSLSGTGEVGLASNYGGESTLSVDRIAFGFLKDDAILVVPEANNGVAIQCALAQIAVDPTLVSGVQTFSIANGASRFNQAGGLGQNYTKGVTRVFNLGPAKDLALHTWSVSNGFLQLRAANLAGAAATAQPVVDNLVSLKAQYGFDTRVGVVNPENGMQVTQWSSGMVDADNDLITGGPGDYQRIAAVRIAVVARSRTPERPAAGASCTTTLVRPQVFVNSSPVGVAAPLPISVNVAVASDTTDWKCYRYRVFETIVPMRNLAWRPTAQ